MKLEQGPFQVTLAYDGREARRRCGRRFRRGKPVSRWAVVLAGGVGSRFWPLSTPNRPKQLLPLVTNEPLLAEAVARLKPIAPPDRVLILTNEALVPAIS